jgi:nitrogen fixation NifU-like protein
MHDTAESLWKEVIVDHSQFPRRHGRIDTPSHQGIGENPFCGDRVSLQLQIDDAGRIRDAAFEATGCAISLASASLLTDKLVGRTVMQAGQLFDAVHQRLTGDMPDPGDGLGELEALVLVRRYPSRVKCATLCWHVLKSALEGVTGVASTE